VGAGVTLSGELSDSDAMQEFHAKMDLTASDNKKGSRHHNEVGCLLLGVSVEARLQVDFCYECLSFDFEIFRPND
jgi:hypothetical protein